MAKIETVVFDMDGVLFDTERLCYRCWCEVAPEFGVGDMTDFFPSCIGRNETDVRALCAKHYGEDFDFDLFHDTASVRFHRHIDEEGVPVKKGVREILTFLRERGVRIALASSSRESTVRKNLAGAGIEEFFEAVITGDMVEHSKPEPDIYLKACEACGTAPALCMAIEDSPNGIRSAYRAGMMPVMVPDMLPADEEMHKLSYSVESDLLAVIKLVERILKC